MVSNETQSLKEGEMKTLKRIGLALLVMVCMLSFANVAVFAEKKGDARKGKYAFRKTCRTCHKEGASAKPLNPDSKTQAQWERTFRKEKYEGYECHEEWAKLSEDDLLNIFTYLHAHALDSPSPAKCK